MQVGIPASTTLLKQARDPNERGDHLPFLNVGAGIIKAIDLALGENHFNEAAAITAAGLRPDGVWLETKKLFTKVYSHLKSL